MDLEFEFQGQLWYWKGPAPWYFVTVPEPVSLHLHDAADAVSYGWGMIPVRTRIGGTSWDTSLFPKNGLYLVPVKASVRETEDLDEGDSVQVWLSVRWPSDASSIGEIL